MRCFHLSAVRTGHTLWGLASTVTGPWGVRFSRKLNKAMQKMTFKCGHPFFPCILILSHFLGRDMHSDRERERECVFSTEV